MGAEGGVRHPYLISTPTTSGIHILGEDHYLVSIPLCNSSCLGTVARGHINR
jgi:hypothetical protein